MPAGAKDRERKADIARKAAEASRGQGQARRAGAKQQAEVAERERARAEHAKRVASARASAQEAFASLAVDPERSLQLALSAAKTVADPLVENSLRQALIESRLRLVLPTGARVRSASYSPDGNRVVVASDDGIARIFSVKSDKRRLLHRLRDRRSIFAASFDPTGARVITAGVEPSAKIWSATTGKLVHSLPHRASVKSASL